MAENSVEPEPEWSNWALDIADDTQIAMETLLATLRAFEDVLRQQPISAVSSTEYCDNFCQALMHYAGSRNSVEHGLPLLEVYCLSINCFASARSYLTASSDSVALVLKRLALSCFELLLSVPENDIPYEAWVQFHHSLQIAHDTLLQYGSTDMQALLQITGEGGAWSNLVLTALLTGQPTNPEEVDAYISLEGEGFMEMRVKHLEKMGEMAKAVVLAKACTECSCISNKATFRQTYVSLLCHLLPNEEAIMEISRLDCKDVLEITCNLETEGEENTAFILCTTFLTQQLQQQRIYCSWCLTLLWSKLQRRIDPSVESLLERCLQLGAIAKTVHHLLYLVRVIRAEAEELGLASSVELSVKALQLPKQDDSETRISVCKTVSCLLPNDLEVLRACLLTEFLLGPSQEVFGCLEELYLRPDQKNDQENGVIPNSLRCELFLALKAYWPFDPEFWDWKTLKNHCISLLGLTPESEGEEEEGEERQETVKHEPQGQIVKVEESEHLNKLNGSIGGCEQCDEKDAKNIQGQSQTKSRKFCCQICKKLVSIATQQILYHSRKHGEGNSHPCPICSAKFQSRKKLVPHMKQHIVNPALFSEKYEVKNDLQKQIDEDDEIEPGEIPVDPSLMLYYESTHDPDVLHHIVQQAKSGNMKRVDDDEHITFSYIDIHFNLQNRDEYPCPGTHCTKTFKHSKYLYVHLKAEHKDDENVRHFHEMRDKREKCIFCRRHFASAYHHRKHRRVHCRDQPYTCAVTGCGANFSSSHEVVTHKQTHGYQLNYQCELEGCYVTFSDLAQIYHHEAQHFRDAAFTCTGPECKKYYLSKKEFIQHLSTHNITFSEDDFEAQRKAKQKLLETVTEETACPKKAGDSKTISVVVANGDNHTASSMRCASSLHTSPCKEPKGPMTPVAMCFDGSKFTCGFEKCGMTFSRARDVQRHLKCAHPEHLKLENKEHRHDKDRGSKSKGLKIKTEPNSEEKGGNEPSTPCPPKGDGKERKPSPYVKCNETNSPGLAQNDDLNEILIGLSKLDLSSSCSDSGPDEPSQSISNTSQISLHKAIMAKSPVVLLQKKPPHLPEERVKVKSEQVSVTAEVSSVDFLATAKPYTCEFNRCDFKSARSYSLLRHYKMKHGRTREQAKKMTSMKTTAFKPYVCHLCSKSHREKRVLRAHYIQVHKFSEALMEKISIAAVQQGGSKATEPAQRSPQPLRTNALKARKREVPNWQRRYQRGKVSKRRENDKTFDNHSPSEEEAEDEAENGEEVKQKVESEARTSQQGRTTRRLVAKSNLCYILTKFNKPFHCVVKDCAAAFSTQGGLVRHLQLIHHYNRSQLLLEKDVDMHENPEVRKEPAKKRPVPHSDEPQPQYKCNFANCNASYHLKSSLVRHTRDFHFRPPEPIRCQYEGCNASYHLKSSLLRHTRDFHCQPPIRCKYEGCTRVFNHASAHKKHILYSHCEYYDSLVLRLQSTHKKSISGCQKKLIVTSPSLQKEEADLPTTQPLILTPKSEVAAQSEETGEGHIEGNIEVPTNKSAEKTYDSFTYRSHEEALQMCQDRCLLTGYPCMVQDCDSVVKYLQSINRHYLKVHRMYRQDFLKNEDKLVFNAEQLEELIQRTSARPTITGACSPNGVRKMEYQAEPDNPGGQSAPMSLHSIKTEILDEDDHNPLCFPEEEPSPVERNNVLVGADDVLYGEPSTGGHTEEPATTTQNSHHQERLRWQNISLTPVTVDLSPPSSLRFTHEDGGDGGKMKNRSAALLNPPIRQPLKRKNELSEQPSNLTDVQPHCPVRNPFNIATYKPIGFESSFLKFIQDTRPKDKDMTLLKGRDSFRRSCSVKENNQLGITHTRSKRIHSPLLKPLTMTGDFTSVQNLKSILDKALAGCGDLAIKQLQYLRPVVVLERPVCTTTLPDLFPSDTNNSKLLLGS
ncbi:zinc finger protein Rlf [Diretmus argenteus]